VKPRALQVFVFAVGLLVGGRGCILSGDICAQSITLEEIPTGTFAVSGSGPYDATGEIRVFEDRVELQLVDELGERGATYARTGWVDVHD
jgi:hypothetical protein